MIKVMLLCSTEATTPTQSLQFNKQSGHRRPTLNSVQRGQMRAVVPPLLSQPCTKHPLLHSTGKDTYPTICLRRYHVHGLTTGTQSAVADDLRKCFFVLVSSHLLSACVWCMCILMRMMYVCMHIDVCVCARVGWGLENNFGCWSSPSILFLRQKLCCFLLHDAPLQPPLLVFPSFIKTKKNSFILTYFLTYLSFFLYKTCLYK